MKAASLILRFFSFPLLAKELTEAAARRRTYVIRVVYGVLLFVLVALWAPQTLLRDGARSMQMGMGIGLFREIIILEFAGLILFLPALMCGSITHEKERDSLVLLLLTDLRPMSVILQKFAAGLVPVLSFLLLAMPLTGVAYAFGGISTSDLFWSATSLALTALQIGALSLMLSAWCQSTVGAFIGAYLWTVALYAGLPFIVGMFRLGRIGGGIEEKITFILTPATILNEAHVGYNRASWTINWKFMALKIGIILLSTVIFLVLARFFLVRRAFLPFSSVFLRLFRILDRFMKWANRFVGNITLVRESRSLPEDEPVAWREIACKALGKAHYLFRILVAIEIPVIFLCFAAALPDGYGSSQTEGLSVLASVVGALGVLALSAQAANTIVSERIQQTLEVVLTTPLGATEIVRQKDKALLRMRFILAIPLITIFGAECWAKYGSSGSLSHELLRNDGAIMYAACAALSVLIFLPLVSWLSLWIGLKTRTRFKAIVAALAVIVAWCALPQIAVSLAPHADGAAYPTGSLWKAVGLLSPLSIVGVNEAGELGQAYNAPVLVIFATFSFYGFVLWLIRRQALRHADFYLRR